MSFHRLVLLAVVLVLCNVAPVPSASAQTADAGSAGPDSDGMADLPTVVLPMVNPPAVTPETRLTTEECEAIRDEMGLTYERSDFVPRWRAPSELVAEQRNRFLTECRDSLEPNQLIHDYLAVPEFMKHLAERIRVLRADVRACTPPGELDFCGNSADCREGWIISRLIRNQIRISFGAGMLTCAFIIFAYVAVQRLLANRSRREPKSKSDK